MSFPPNELHQVSPHVYWFTPESRTDRASLALALGEKYSLMLDIGASPKHTSDFLQAIETANLPKPNYAILTHWHWDHWFGIEALDIPVIAYRETAENMRRQKAYDFSDKGLEWQIAQGVEIAFCTEHMQIEMNEAERKALQLREADIIFDGRMEFDLGGVTCKVEHISSDHASDAVVMFIPEDEVLFLGDCLYPAIYIEPRHYTRQVLLPLIDKLESFGAKKFIEGHSNGVLELDEVQAMFQWMRLASRLIEQYGSEDETLLKTEMLNATLQNEDALDFLHEILAGEKLGISQSSY